MHRQRVGQRTMIQMQTCSRVSSRLTQYYTALSRERSKVLTFINDTFDDIHAALGSWPHGNVNIPLKRVTKLEQQQATVKDTSIEIYQTSNNAQVKVSSREIKYSWPGNTPEEAWRFGIYTSTTHKPSLSKQCPASHCQTACSWSVR